MICDETIGNVQSQLWWCRSLNLKDVCRLLCSSSSLPFFFWFCYYLFCVLSAPVVQQSQSYLLTACWILCSFFFLKLFFLFHSFFQFFVVSLMFVFKINEKQVLYLRLHVCVCVVRVIRYRLRIMKNSVVVSAEALAF